MLTKPKISPLIITAFALSILYWIYLSFICQMYLWHDAIGYEGLGDKIYRYGWIEYFKSGPNREPIYPGLIALSKHIAEYLQTSYKAVQMFFQILILFWTQILTYKLLKKLNIKPWITALTILYLGFSPAMFISTFRLYSEIATYPFILLIILNTLICWKNIYKDTKTSSLILSSIFLGLSFLGAVFVKGVFQIVFPICLLPFIFFVLKSIQQKNKPLFKKTGIILLSIIVSYALPLNLYKLGNKLGNGKFTLTDRGSWALYGNTARRMDTLTFKRFLMAITYIPRPEGCYTLFGNKDCQVWHYSESDKYGYGKLGDLNRQGLSLSEVDKELLRLSFKEVFKNPFQYALFWVLEGTKLFFWEFTSMAYVVYPSWMIAAFYFTPFHLGLNALMTFLSFVAFLYLWKNSWKNKNKLFALSKPCDESNIIILSIATLITSFIAAHCFFFVLPRYVFPIVPLYLVSIAFLLNNLIKNKK